MEKDKSIIKINQNLINQVGYNFNLVDKLLNIKNLKNWWKSIDETWKEIFRKSINIDTEPNQEQLQKIINLEKIYCINTEIMGLEPLRIFKFLNNIDLMNCENIDSIEALSSCREIKILRIFYTKVENIEVVKHFNKLEEFYLSDYVISLEPVADLINLKKLFFRHNLSITSLDIITSLVNLEELVISDSISDLSPIDKFKKLKRLVCYGVNEIEANRFKAIHPNTEIIFGEKQKKKNSDIVERFRKEGERIGKEGLSENQKNMFGLE